MDWYSRKVLSWRLSNSLDTEFCVAAVEEALAKYGKPDIFNTDQGSQFTSAAFTGLLQTHDIQISMDGRGRCLDNVFIERLWRSLKYEDVYLNNYETGAEARVGIGKWNALLQHASPAQQFRRNTAGSLLFRSIGQCCLTQSALSRCL